MNENAEEEASEQHDDGVAKKRRLEAVIGERTIDGHVIERCLVDFADEVLPPLTLYRGREKLSRRKSALVVGLLYVSHSFSAWVSFA